MLEPLLRYRSLIVTGVVTAAATLGLALVVWAFREHAREDRLGEIMITSEQAPQVAELLDDAGELALPPFTVPTQVPLEIEPGDYRLRVGATGEIGRTFDVSIPRGQSRMFPILDDDRYRWKLEAEFREYELLDFDTRADPVILGEPGVTRINAATGEPVWEFKVEAHLEALKEQLAGFMWPANQFNIDRHYGRNPRPRWTLAPSIDVNADGTPDVIVACLRQAWLLALNGASGETLWITGRGSDVLEPTPGMLSNSYRSEIVSSAVGRPLVVGDLDGDDIDDLVSTFYDTGSDPYSSKQGELTRWTEAVSGATGEQLWRFDYDPDPFMVGSAIPLRLRIPLESVNESGTGGGSSWSYERVVRHRPQRMASGAALHAPDSPRLIAGADGKPTLLTIGGGHLTTLDPVTGDVLTSTTPSFPAAAADWTPDAPIQTADVDADGEPELVLMNRVQPATGRGDSTRLVVWSPSDSTVLWQKDLKAYWPVAVRPRIRPPVWPQIDDLDGDGQLEMIAPTAAPIGVSDTRPWGSISVFNAATGAERWSRQLFNMDQQVDHFTIGPDLDGDGVREVFAAVLWGDQTELYVDALSGRDGSTLWRTNQSLRQHERMSREYRLASIQVWSAGGDGWPQLVVRALCDGDAELPMALFLSSGTGRVLHIGRGIHDVRAKDIDADGVDDLVTIRATSDKTRELSCVRGMPADRMRALRSRWRNWTNEQWYRVGDLDGDGIDDLATCDADGVAVAVSSVSGRELWRASHEDLRQGNHSFATTHPHSVESDRDFDGDGIADILIANNASGMRPLKPFIALSGASGRRLWSAGFSVSRMRDQALLVTRDLDGDGEPEVIAAASYPPNANRMGGWEERVSLSVLSGRTGAVKWQHFLQTSDNPWASQPTAEWFNTGMVDLDGNGVVDLVVPAEPEDGSSKFELRAYRGEDGHLMWQHALRTHRQQNGFDDVFPVAVCDADGDGRPEVIAVDVVEIQTRHGSMADCHIRMLDGATGEERWSWKEVVSHSTAFSQRRPLRPVVISTADGLRVCLSHADSRERIVMLDASGSAVSAPTQEDSRRGVDYRRRLTMWSADVDANGSDELVFLHPEKLAVARPDAPTEPLWEQPITDYSTLTIVPATGSRATQLVVREGDAGTVTGFNAATGEVVWSCPTGPNYIAWDNHAAIQLLFNERDPSAPPNVLLAFSDETLCRQAIPSDRDALASLPRPAPVLRPSGRDPRLARRLPWAMRPEALGPTVVRLLWSSLFSMLLLWVPLAFFWRMIARRQWGLRTLLAAPAIVAMVLMVQRFSPPIANEYWTIGTRWGMAMTTFPAIVFIGAISLEAYRRAWRMVRFYVLLTLGLIIVATGGALVVMTFDTTPRQPGEYYRMDGWYFIVFTGCYLTGLALTLGLGLREVALLFTRRPPNESAP